MFPEQRRSAPGVWPMSPMFTLCHELRSKIRGGRPALSAAAKSDERSAPSESAAVAEEADEMAAVHVGKRTQEVPLTPMFQ